MKTKLATIVSAVVLTLSAGIAGAEPMQLTAVQMDKVAAGGTSNGYYCSWCATNTASAYANAIAFGYLTKTNTATFTATVAGWSSESGSYSKSSSAGPVFLIR